MLLVGLDPGTTTGVATWSPPERRLLSVCSMKLHEAMRWVIEDAVILADPLGGILVLFEDARQRKYFGKMDAKQAKYGAAIREGAGAAKRDATIWDDFLTAKRIPFLALAPRKTKRNAAEFRALTGWTEPTNEHSRDAGMIVAGITLPHAELLLERARRRFQPGPKEAAR